MILSASIFISGDESINEIGTKPLTKKYFLVLPIFIAAILLLPLAFDNVKLLLGNNMFMSLGYVFIGAIWSYQIHSALARNIKYNKSLNQIGANNAPPG